MRIVRKIHNKMGPQKAVSIFGALLCFSGIALGTRLRLQRQEINNEIPPNEYYDLALAQTCTRQFFSYILQEIKNNITDDFPYHTILSTILSDLETRAIDPMDYFGATKDLCPANPQDEIAHFLYVNQNYRFADVTLSDWQKFLNDLNITITDFPEAGTARDYAKQYSLDRTPFLLKFYKNIRDAELNGDTIVYMLYNFPFRVYTPKLKIQLLHTMALLKEENLKEQKFTIPPWSRTPDLAFSEILKHLEKVVTNKNLTEKLFWLRGVVNKIPKIPLLEGKNLSDVFDMAESFDLPDDVKEAAKDLKANLSGLNLGGETENALAGYSPLEKLLGITAKLAVHSKANSTIYLKASSLYAHVKMRYLMTLGRYFQPKTITDIEFLFGSFFSMKPPGTEIKEAIEAFRNPELTWREYLELFQWRKYSHPRILLCDMILILLIPTMPPTVNKALDSFDKLYCDNYKLRPKLSRSVLAAINNTKVTTKIFDGFEILKNITRAEFEIKNTLFKPKCAGEEKLIPLRKASPIPEKAEEILDLQTATTEYFIKALAFIKEKILKDYPQQIIIDNILKDLQNKNLDPLQFYANNAPGLQPSNLIQKFIILFQGNRYKDVTPSDWENFLWTIAHDTPKFERENEIIQFQRAISFDKLRLVPVLLRGIPQAEKPILTPPMFINILKNFQFEVPTPDLPMIIQELENQLKDYNLDFKDMKLQPNLTDQRFILAEIIKYVKGKVKCDVKRLLNKILDALSIDQNTVYYDTEHFETLTDLFPALDAPDDIILSAAGLKPWITILGINGLITNIFNGLDVLEKLLAAITFLKLTPEVGKNATAVEPFIYLRYLSTQQRYYAPITNEDMVYLLDGFVNNPHILDRTLIPELQKAIASGIHWRLYLTTFPWQNFTKPREIFCKASAEIVKHEKNVSVDEVKKLKTLLTSKACLGTYKPPEDQKKRRFDLNYFFGRRNLFKRSSGRNATAGLSDAESTGTKKKVKKYTFRVPEMENVVVNIIMKDNTKSKTINSRRNSADLFMDFMTGPNSCW